MTDTTTTTTKLGRPAKHADAAARQRAYRASNKVKTMRLTGKTPAAVAGLAEYFEMSETEVVNQLLKFALTNRDWKHQGMTSWSHPDRRFSSGKATAVQAPAACNFVTGNSTSGVAA